MKSKNKAFGITVLTVFIAIVMIDCSIYNDDKKEVDISKYYLNPPTGVVATKLSTSELHITWNAVSGAERYEISVRSNLDSEDTRLSIGSTSDTSTAHGYYNWYWYNYSSRAEQVATLYYYIKAHPSLSGYIASGWSNPASVRVR